MARYKEPAREPTAEERKKLALTWPFTPYVRKQGVLKDIHTIHGRVAREVDPYEQTFATAALHGWYAT